MFLSYSEILKDRLQPSTLSRPMARILKAFFVHCTVGCGLS